LECQPGVTFKSLFSVHPDFIPPVIPGTVHATLAGGIAHDVHGKNNHKEGSFGTHVLWMDVLVGDTLIRCSRKQNSDLFYASIAGLGLTGFIVRLGLQMKKSSRFVQVQQEHYSSLESLMTFMTTKGLDYDYQVAWLDLLNTPHQGLLSLANYCEPVPYKKHLTLTVPKLPLSLINSWSMKCFNQLYSKRSLSQQSLSLEQFNNPLDKIQHWNRLYGPKGLIQFQAVFAEEQGYSLLSALLESIKKAKATPTLAVLKVLTQTGEGLLSFCKPGFTLAIDFINNEQAKQAIRNMNQYITDIKGSVYLAKDLLLTQEQCHSIYPKLDEFKQVLHKYNSSLQSDLSKRLGITL
jgi:hypothetical protein